MTKLITILSILTITSITQSQEIKLYGEDGTYLGKANTNKYDPESISNPYGKYGSKYSSTSVNNENGVYGSKYSTKSANNEYTTKAPVIIGNENNGNEEYLGRLSKNKYDSESSSNSYGQFGSKYSNSSINNKNSKWGQSYHNSTGASINDDEDE